MNDTVLAGWGELLPLLIFILLGWLANRAKQKKEEELLGNPGQPKPPGQDQSKGGRPVPARRQPHTVDDGEDVEDWTGEEWEDEDDGRWNDRRGGEVRAEQPRPAQDRVERVRPSPPKPVSRAPEAQRQLPSDRDSKKDPLIPAKTKEKAAVAGKDLLSKLAKELGIELPTPQPRPAPKPAQAPKAPTKPSSLKTPAPRDPAHAHAPRSHGMSPDEVRFRATEATRSQARPASIASVAPMAAPVAKPLISAAEIANAESMRKAFVLKTILDKPRSLKPRGFKPD